MEALCNVCLEKCFINYFIIINLLWMGEMKWGARKCGCGSETHMVGVYIVRGEDRVRGTSQQVGIL